MLFRLPAITLQYKIMMKALKHLCRSGEAGLQCYQEQRGWQGGGKKAAFICSKELRESVKVSSDMQVVTSFTSLRFVVPALLKDKICHPFTYARDETVVG